MKNFKPGIYQSQGSYRSFQPAPINRPFALENMEVVALLSQADRELGKLDMYSKYIPSVDLFIQMHVAKEATQSSRIEGTRTSMDEAFLAKEDLPLDKRDDWEEVQNYIQAMNWSVGELQNLPFSNRLLREAHRMLMRGVRGDHKQPGAFRRSQNWLGGATIRDAVFVPPVHSTVPDLMGDMELFLHNEEILMPDLLKIALAHYQFETIHPFLDGNGRIGRLMIPLFLVSKGLLARPVLYLSDFFERHRKLYYENLTLVREKGDLAQWFKFFLAGVIETAQRGIEAFDGILQMQKRIEEDLERFGARAVKARRVMNQLFQHPVIDAGEVAKVAGVSLPTAYKFLAEFEGMGILVEGPSFGRGRTFYFDSYLRLFR